MRLGELAMLRLRSGGKFQTTRVVGAGLCQGVRWSGESGRCSIWVLTLDKPAALLHCCTPANKCCAPVGASPCVAVARFFFRRTACAACTNT